MQFKNVWPQKKNVKKGTTKRQLHIPTGKNIPFGLLEEIKNTEIGKVAHNPTDVGEKSYRVTPLMKQRAVSSLNLKRIGKRK